MKPIIASGLSLLVLAAGVPFSMAMATPLGVEQIAQRKQAGVALRTMIRQEETLYLSSGETHEYTLRLDAAATVNGRNLPRGSIIRGRFEPAEGGLRYVADSAEVSNEIIRFNAASEVLRDEKDPRETSTGAILGDAAIGAAGGLILGEVLGDADAWEIIGGAAAGVVVGNVTAPYVVVIEPGEPIVLYTQ